MLVSLCLMVQHHYNGHNYTKPIIFITTDELKKQICDITNAFADELGKNVININNIPYDINWDNKCMWMN